MEAVKLASFFLQSIEFTQQLDCASGYGYEYTKTIRLLKNEPVMTIEHHLVNTGGKTIETEVYDHNFLIIDHQGAGPAIEITFPFAPKPTKTLDPLAEVLEVSRVRGAVLEVEAIFGGARHIAIARAAQTTVDIDTVARTIYVSVDGDTVRRKEIGTDHGVRLAASRMRMSYTPTGMGYGAANLSVVVRRNAAADTVFVSRLGRLRH